MLLLPSHHGGVSHPRARTLALLGLKCGTEAPCHPRGTLCGVSRALRSKSPEGLWGYSPQDAQAAARSPQSLTEEAHAAVTQRAVSQLQLGQARVLRQQRCQLCTAALGQLAPLQPAGEHGEQGLSTSHLSWLLTCPPNPQVKKGLASPWLLAIVPGEQRGSTNPLTPCTMVRVSPPTARIPALVWAPRASLTGAPAGHCPGAAEPGRAGGWGRAAPPAAA